jgi:hypothetical protein
MRRHIFRGIAGAVGPWIARRVKAMTPFDESPEAERFRN